MNDVDNEKYCQCEDENGFLTVPFNGGFKIIFPKCGREIKE